MKLTENKLRQIIREELSRLTEAPGFDELQNTNVSFVVKFPKREYVDYQDIWPFVRTMKKNGVKVGNWTVTPDSYDRGDDIPVGAEIMNFGIEGNAADVLLALSRLKDHQEILQIHHYGEVGIDNRRLYIDPAIEEEGFPSIRMTVTGVEGAMKDKHGTDARRAIIRQFGFEFSSRSGGRPGTMK